MSSTEMILAPNSVANADPIYYKDATELASLIRAKQLSSREVVQAHLDRIKAINPKINAIVTLLAEDALKAADAADAAVRNGAKLGPLHGVPFTIKDSIACVNTRCIPTKTLVASAYAIHVAIVGGV